ncbi:MAG: hypothetical protein LDL07_03535 [Desulfarculus sp.]|nr:hypothetical protein [Desulfarculus sp.]
MKPEQTLTRQDPRPPGATNLERRVKRQAWAPEHDLFAVTAPGLEPVCAHELVGLGADEARATPGGVLFRGRLDSLYAANLWLRSAGRVLLRLKDFRVRTWEDLLRQAASVPWEVWLGAGAQVRVRVALHESNLRHEGRITEEVFQAAANRLASLGLKPPRLIVGGGLEDQEDDGGDQAEAPNANGDQPPQTILVRGVDRRASLSLDGSGAHLHRRGYRLAPGPAPLREDLAAALLIFCDYDGDQPLLDPFCGAGTLAIEAGLIARRLAPGLARDFAFTAWPSFREPTWRHLRKQAQAATLPAPPRPIHARDVSAPALEACRANIRRAGLEGQIEVQRADFFSADPPPGPGLVVINPPYGHRLGSVRQAADLARRIGQRLRLAYPGWRVGLVLYRPEWAADLGLTQVRTLAAPHGGLKVSLLCGEVPA